MNKWLTNTDLVVPDNDMEFGVSKTEERVAIIQYLKSVSAKWGKKCWDEELKHQQVGPDSSKADIRPVLRRYRVRGRRKSVTSAACRRTGAESGKWMQGET
jgi:hypothetical protein